MSAIVEGIEHTNKNEEEIVAEARIKVVRIINSMPLDKTRIVWHDLENPSDNYLEVEKGSKEDGFDTRIFILNPKLIFVPLLRGFEMSDIDSIIFANTILNRIRWIEEMNISPEIS